MLNQKRSDYKKNQKNDAKKYSYVYILIFIAYMLKNKTLKTKLKNISQVSLHKSNQKIYTLRCKESIIELDRVSVLRKLSQKFRP